MDGVTVLLGHVVGADALVRQCFHTQDVGGNDDDVGFFSLMTEFCQFLLQSPSLTRRAGITS